MFYVRKPCAAFCAAMNQSWVFPIAELNNFPLTTTNWWVSSMRSPHRKAIGIGNIMIKPMDFGCHPSPCHHSKHLKTFAKAAIAWGFRAANWRWDGCPWVAPICSYKIQLDLKTFIAKEAKGAKMAKWSRKHLMRMLAWHTKEADTHTHIHWDLLCNLTGTSGIKTSDMALARL